MNRSEQVRRPDMNQRATQSTRFKSFFYLFLNRVRLGSHGIHPTVVPDASSRFARDAV
ncbi:hypothetical protein THIOKS12250083 [Thiocapsa sp. KS1]|nr:hypothetical protein THIOKS12250083 [Thiocapsa sp. KS1]